MVPVATHPTRTTTFWHPVIKSCRGSVSDAEKCYRKTHRSSMPCAVPHTRTGRAKNRSSRRDTDLLQYAHSSVWYFQIVFRRFLLSIAFLLPRSGLPSSVSASIYNFKQYVIPSKSTLVTLPKSRTRILLNHSLDDWLLHPIFRHWLVGLAPKSSSKSRP